MDNAIVVLAIIEAKSNSIEKIKEEALKIVPLTLKEPGCITYQLHQDTDSSKTFTFYEVWENQKALDAHNHSEHLQSFIKNIDGNTENITVKTMNVINDIH